MRKILCWLGRHQWRHDWTQYRERSLEGQYIRHCDRCGVAHQGDREAYRRNADAMGKVWAGLGGK